MALGFIGISTFIFGFMAFGAFDSDFLPAITDTCFYLHEKKRLLKLESPHNSPVPDIFLIYMQYISYLFDLVLNNCAVCFQSDLIPKNSF